MRKYLGTKALLDTFREAGLYHTRSWLYNMEQQGRLVCPRSPTSNRRMFTKEQMAEIVVAFSPFGVGEWRP